MNYNDPAKCNRQDNGLGTVDSLRAECLRYAVLETADSRYCEAMTGNVIKSKNECLNFVAVVQGDKQFCAKIE